MVKFVYFGTQPAGGQGSKFSEYVLEELKNSGFEPVLNITSARDKIDMDKLREISADVFIVASFGKILKDELINMPKFKTLNVHPSLLPKLRGPAPIQSAILGEDKTGVTIIRMDEKMDHGPIVAQEVVDITPWPDHYSVVEEKLGRAGGKLLVSILDGWVNGEVKEVPQDDSQATSMKFIKKEDGLLDLSDSAEKNLRKVYAYSTWPGAYIIFNGRTGEKRVVIKDAKVLDGVFTPTHVIPAGKKEMDWQDFLRGNS
jgi:methionyl-tRNA formyltransferase